jgi:hypothetical protein
MERDREATINKITISTIFAIMRHRNRSAPLSPAWFAPKGFQCHSHGSPKTYWKHRVSRTAITIVCSILDPWPYVLLERVVDHRFDCRDLNRIWKGSANDPLSQSFNTQSQTYRLTTSTMIAKLDLNNSRLGLTTQEAKSLKSLQKFSRLQTAVLNKILPGKSLLFICRQCYILSHV